MKPADARSASFNPQHAAYNPTSSMSTPVRRKHWMPGRRLTTRSTGPLIRRVRNNVLNTVHSILDICLLHTSAKKTHWVTMTLILAISGTKHTA